MMVPQPSRTIDLQRKEELLLQKQIRQSTCKVKNNLPTLIGWKISVEIEIDVIIVLTRGITRFQQQEAALPPLPAGQRPVPGLPAVR